MAQTQINGATQIKAASIPWAQMASGAIVPTSALVDTFIKANGLVAMSAALNMGSNLINYVSNPVAATDAANKAYVDAKISGMTIFGAKVVAVANSAVTGLITVDGYTLLAGDVVLLTAQTTPSQNGPWVAASGAWARPTWWASGAVIPIGAYFIIDAEGTTYKNTKWFVTNVTAVTVDTTALTTQQDLSGTLYSAGTGLSLAGTVFSVTYGTSAGTAAQGNDTRIANALQTTSLGTGVLAALGIAIGSAGAPVLFGGAGGTPTSLTLTNATGLPLGGVTGFGTGVAAALAANIGSAGAPVVLNGAGGTPSSLTLTNATGLPTTALTGYLGAAQFPALTGDVTTSAGSLTTTINNTSGSGFVKYTDFVTDEVPTGATNGVNATFTLANAPATGYGAISTLELYLNGVLLQPGAGDDYTLSGSTITALLIPQTGDKLIANYIK